MPSNRPTCRRCACLHVNANDGVATCLWRRLVIAPVDMGEQHQQCLNSSDCGFREKRRNDNRRIILDLMCALIVHLRRDNTVTTRGGLPYTDAMHLDELNDYHNARMTEREKQRVLDSVRRMP